MTSEYFDVVIVGAGLSGIGAACHLLDKCPNKRFIILESRESMGGTWDLFRYPGIRSDSDMHTMGYNFKPWRGARAIADGPAILEYVKETAAERGVDERIRYRHRVVSASWSSSEATWDLEVRREGSDSTLTIRCNFLLMCSGYYRYDHGHTPDFQGRERFTGVVVHPQHWPGEFDYRDKRVVVIGSGATAVTLLPEMAKDARHIVMLQRSPTYMISWPDTDVVAKFLERVLPAKWAYGITRWKNIVVQQWIYRQTRKRPETVKRKLLQWVREELGEDYDVETHFTPRYNPWDERLCLVPNGDLFAAIRSGKASVVTGNVDTFTENGLLLESGDELEAEIIVTATGLDLLVLGGVGFAVDGEPVDFAHTFTYKGIMSSGVPNMISTFGYINASWTLRADLTAEYACRVINHLDATGCRQCTPLLRDEDRDMPSRPWFIEFLPGYIERSIKRLPRQGDREPWINPQNFKRDKKMFRAGDLEDGALVFSNRERREQCA